MNGQFETVETAIANVEIKRGQNIIPDIKLEGIKVSKKQAPKETTEPQPTP